MLPLDLVCCPCCRAPLRAGGAKASFACTACAGEYPTIGGIPVLVRNPDGLLAHCRSLVKRFDDEMRLGLDELLAQMTTSELSEKTRARLETLHEHLGRHHRRLIELARDAGLDGASTSPDRMGDPALHQTSFVDYYAQIHRDWGWDADGSSEALDATRVVSEAIGEQSVGRLMVLGAGACRLALDLHRRHRATLTLALDVNPLPFLVAKKLLGGEAVRLYEFPPWPLDSKKPFVDRTLASPTPLVDDTFQLLFADALAAPVRTESFDTVLTPWFIDQVDMARLFEAIRGLLPSGGRWINFGPLIYRHEETALPRRYCADEVLEFVEANGFRVDRHAFERMPYMQSPVSSQGRTETILTFSAEKLAEKPSRTTTPHLPWLADDRAPVPRLPELESYRGEHPMFQAIVDLIDGVRSAADIANEMVRFHGLPVDGALVSVRACLAAVARKLARSGQGG